MAIREQELQIPAVVLLRRIRNGEEEVLLVRHEGKAPRKEGEWGFPGGRPKQGENPLDTALRELREETGLETTSDNLIPFPKKGNIFQGVHQRESGKRPYTIQVFEVVDSALVSGKLKKRKTSETREEAIPAWARVKTLDRRAKLMPSVNQIVSEKH